MPLIGEELHFHVWDDGGRTSPLFCALWTVTNDEKMAKSSQLKILNGSWRFFFGFFQPFVWLTASVGQGSGDVAGFLDQFPLPLSQLASHGVGSRRSLSYRPVFATGSLFAQIDALSGAGDFDHDVVGVVSTLEQRIVGVETFCKIKWLFNGGVFHEQQPFKDNDQAEHHHSPKKGFFPSRTEQGSTYSVFADKG